MRPPPPHRATTAHLQALYPFVSPGGLEEAGALIGRDLLGGYFCFDPWDLYRQGRLTNPNALVLGQLGRGKSTFVKTLVWRQLAFGRQAWIVDPKGEYGPLSRAAGTRPLTLQPGGPLRLNPLEVPGRSEHAEFEERSRIRLELVASLLDSSLGRTLRPEERSAVEVAIRATGRVANQPTLPQVVEALLRPEADDARELGTTTDILAADGRVAALEVRRMVRGDLAGMFDGPTSDGIDLGAHLVVLDLSPTFSSAALPLIMTCATAWLKAALSARSGPKRLVVIDEAWAILADLATARWTQAAFKLSRAMGISNVIVVHRISDLRAAGGDGSTQQKLADGLLADSETRVVFGQAPSEAASTGAVLGLSRAETELIGRLPRGVALWKVGGRSHLVQHIVASTERELVDTDAAMVDT